MAKSSLRQTPKFFDRAWVRSRPLVLSLRFRPSPTVTAPLTVATASAAGHAGLGVAGVVGGGERRPGPGPRRSSCEP